MKKLKTIFQYIGAGLYGFFLGGLFVGGTSLLIEALGTHSWFNTIMLAGSFYTAISIYQATFKFIIKYD